MDVRRELNVRIARTALLAGWLALCAAGAPLRAVAAPVDVVFTIDNSGSMRRNDPAFITRQVVKDFARALPAQAHLGMVLFDSSARVVAPLAALDAPEAREQLVAKLSAVDFRGQHTNSPEGIERALYELRTHGRPGAAKVIVFLTDGIIDTGDQAADREAGRWLRETLARAAAKAGVRIFGIAFTESADVELIQTLALQTDGEYFRAYRAEDIPGVLDRILTIVAQAPSATPRARAAALEAAPRSAATPSAATPGAVASGPPAGTRGRSLALVAVVLAALGLAGAAAGLALPGRRRARPAAEPAVSPAAAPAAVHPATRPPARLLDIARAGPRGLLPLPIESDRLSIGRDPKSDVVIPRDTISSLHATIEFRDGAFYLEDQRSTNGTRLNQKPLAAHRPAALKSGDRIDFAQYEFRFVIPDREPAGKTVILGGLSLSSELPAGAGPGGPEPPGRSDAALFEECLSRHLERIRALGAPYARFVEAHLGPLQLRDLSRNVERMTGELPADGRGRTESFVGDGVLYVLCVVPDSMEKAAAWFGKHFGGFSKLLGDFLESEQLSRSGCDTLCVVTYGRERDAWVSVTIAPAERSHERIDIMSVELLSEDERRTLALRFDDIGQVL